MAGRRKVPRQYHQVHALAFSPLFFQAAMAARNMGVLGAVNAAKSDGLIPSDVASRAGVSLYAARVLLEGGGNTGKWAQHCLQRDPDVEITVLDHPGQLARLEEHAAAAGVTSRLRTIAMDLLDHTRAFPTGFDVVWMSQFLDCFGEAD